MKWQTTFLSLISFFVGIVHPFVLQQVENLTGVVGQNITLHPGVSVHLHDDVVWWIGPDKRILVSIDEEGGVEWKVNEDGFHLDKETGALTLIQLHKNDSGRYGCQIINGHSSTSEFQLLVVDPPNPPPADPTPSPADPTPSPFGTGPIIAVVLVVLLLAALAVLAFVCWLRNKG